MYKKIYIFNGNMTTITATFVMNKCYGTPGCCGCSTCSMYGTRIFAKKVLGIVHNGTHQPFLGWLWKDETDEKMSKMMMEARMSWVKCESTEGYCGCDDCNRYQILSEQKGIGSDFAERFKRMDLDATHISFRWNYEAADKALEI